MKQSESKNLDSIQTFEEFAKMRGWELSFEGRNACLSNSFHQKLVMINHLYTEMGMLITEVEHVLKEIAMDLVDYSKGCFDGDEIRTREALLQSIQDYRMFASEQELATLVRLLENQKRGQPLSFLNLIFYFNA